MAMSQMERTRKFNERHPERRKAHSRDHARRKRAEDPEAARARYREEDARRDKDELRARRARWREENREAIRAYQRTRHAANPDVQRSRNSARRAATTAVVDRLAIYEDFGGRCGICGEHVDVEAFHLDHVWPLSAGGAHRPENLQPAHPRCNMSKGARLVANGLVGELIG